MKEDSQIAIYQTDDHQTSIEVQIGQDSVWLTQAQMALLFEQTKQNISLHISNIFKEEELERESVVKYSLTTASDGKTYRITHYNLDVIISVGYRVKSKRGTQFRIWATKVLHNYLMDGYALNEKRLREQEQNLKNLQEAVHLVAQVVQKQILTPTEAQGILSILDRYSHALTVLDQYDHQTLHIADTRSVGQQPISYEEAMGQIRLWREKEGLGALFGNEKDESFKGSLTTCSPYRWTARCGKHAPTASTPPPSPCKMSRSYGKTTQPCCAAGRRFIARMGRRARQRSWKAERMRCGSMASEGWSARLRSLPGFVTVPRRSCKKTLHEMLIM